MGRILSPSVSFLNRRIRDFLFAFGIFFTLIAIAGPYWGSKLVKRPNHSRDILIVLDTSRSMLAQDISPSRLKHAKWFIREVIERTPGDRYGLIAFSGSAFLECPLTQDRSGLMLFLDDIDTDTIPVGGTNLEEALETALSAFKAAEGSHRAIVLITDGDELQGDSSEAIDKLKKKKIPVFVVGIGDPSLGSFIQIKDNKFITDKQGKRVKTKLNELSLQKIAQSVGGSYVHSTVVHDGIDHMVEKIKALIPEQRDDDVVSRPIERYQIPLFLGFLCFLVRLSLGERKRLQRKNAAKIYSGLQSIGFCTIQFILWSIMVYSVIPNLSAQINLDESDRINSGNSGHSKNTPAPNLNGPGAPLGFQGSQGVLDPNLNRDLDGIGKEKAALIDKSIQSLQEQLEKTKDPRERGYLHYNLGVNYHFLGRKEEAENEYNSALDISEISPELKAYALQNLGVLRHTEARENLSIDPDQASEQLGEAQEFYRESMRHHPRLEEVATNQELVLKERKLLEELKKVREQLSDLQKDAQEKTEEAHDTQQSANQEQDTEKKAALQSQAKEKSKEAQNTIEKLKKASEDLGQEEAAKKFNEAADDLKKAQEEQQKALDSLANDQTPESNSEKNAEELIRKALEELGVQKEEEQQDDGSESSEQNAANDQDSEEKMDSESDQNEKMDPSESGLEMSEQPPKDSDGEKIDLQNFDKIQALRILDDLQKQEKDLKQELKAMQKKNAKVKEVEKNW